METDRWYYLEAGRAVGPVSKADLEQRAASGLLGNDDLVWLEGMAGWERAANIDGLYIVQTPPPLPIAPPALVSLLGDQRAQRGSTQVQYAGFWRRVAALLIDDLVVVLGTFIAGFSLGFILRAAGMPTDNIASIARGVDVIVGWIYWAGMESSSLQATLGKRMLGIQVTDLQGRRIDIARATGRQIAKILSILTLGIGFLMAAFTEKKQALHDVIAACVVVRTPPRETRVPSFLPMTGEPWR